MKHPDFIIAGEARCGTTSLFETLIQHPQILVPHPQKDGFKYENGAIQLTQKEPRFFDRNWDKGLDWYYSLFEDKPGTITGDGSTMYMFYQEVMDRIYSILPSVKLIISLRNPVDRMISHFHHAFKIDENFAKVYPTFQYFVERELNLIETHQIVGRGFYDESMAHVIKLFDKSQILIIKYENMVENSQREVSLILDFLGVDNVNLDLRHVRQSGAPKIDLLTRQYIADFYKPHNRRLYELIGEDFKW